MCVISYFKYIFRQLLGGHPPPRRHMSNNINTKMFFRETSLLENVSMVFLKKKEVMKLIV